MNIISGDLYDRILKRLVDIIGSVILLIIFSPVCILISILIKLDTHGPVLADTPERVGKDGKLFKMFKFRSMIVNAHDMLRVDPDYKNLYEQYKRNSYKLKKDPRVTRIGKFIRKGRVDDVYHRKN